MKVEASYEGDVDHSASAGSFAITATQRSVAVSVVCVPSSILSLTSTTCTVTVTDTDAGGTVVPSGTVHFTADLGGSFSTVDCTLVDGSCSVKYTAPLVLSPTKVTISATYSGDVDHLEGVGITTVQVS